MKRKLLNMFMMFYLQTDVAEAGVLNEDEGFSFNQDVIHEQFEF